MCRMSWTPLMDCSKIIRTESTKTLRAGTGIRNRDDHARRRDGGKLRHRQGLELPTSPETR